MSKIQYNKISYEIACVYEFAAKKKLTPKQAFVYLMVNKGIDFLEEHYEAEHLLSIDDAIEDLTLICQKNGGLVA